MTSEILNIDPFYTDVSPGSVTCYSLPLVLRSVLDFNNVFEFEFESLRVKLILILLL